MCGISLLSLDIQPQIVCDVRPYSHTHHHQLHTTLLSQRVCGLLPDPASSVITRLDPLELRDLHSPVAQPGRCHLVSQPTSVIDCRV